MILSRFAMEYDGRVYISHPAEMLWDRLLVLELGRMNVDFVTGEAGSGKTYRLIQRALWADHDKEEPCNERKSKNVMIAAASGKAAERIRSDPALSSHPELRRKISTVHTTCRIPIHKLPTWFKALKLRSN